jgi:multidrug efflux system membrane fusion protein
MTTNTTTTDLKSPERVSPPHYEPSPAGKKPGKRGLIWVLLLLFVAAVAGYAVWRAGQPGLIAVSPNAGGGGGRGRGRGAGAFGPTPVAVAKAKKMNVPVYLSGLGNVAAYYTVTVKSRVDGQLMSVNFKEGDMVQQGQLLAQIDPRPYQVQLEQAEGQLARDQALLANAKLDLQRYQGLLAQDAIPKQQLDTQVATVGQDEGNVKTDIANIDNAKLQLTYAGVVAPITGRIGLRLVDPGNIVHASDSTGLLVITQLQPITVFFTIPEDSLPQVIKKLRSGAKLPTVAYNRDNSVALATGSLLTVDNQIDPTTGTSKLKAVFENKDNTLFPNQFVNVRLLVDTKPNQVVVPSVAIQHGQTGPFVFLVDENSKVKMQPVTPDIVLDNDMTSVSSGLADGDTVAVDGTDRLQNGSTIRVRRPGDDGTGGGRGRGRNGKGAKGAGGDKGGDKGAPAASGTGGRGGATH